MLLLLSLWLLKENFTVFDGFRMAKKNPSTDPDCGDTVGETDILVMFSVVIKGDENGKN